MQYSRMVKKTGLHGLEAVKKYMNNLNMAVKKSTKRTSVLKPEKIMIMDDSIEKKPKNQNISVVTQNKSESKSERAYRINKENHI